MTVGYLFDLLIINEIRKEKLASSLELEVVHDLDKQNGFLLNIDDTSLAPNRPCRNICHSSVRCSGCGFFFNSITLFTCLSIFFYPN